MHCILFLVYITVIILSFSLTTLIATFFIFKIKNFVDLRKKILMEKFCTFFKTSLNLLIWRKYFGGKKQKFERWICFYLHQTPIRKHHHE